MLEIELEIYLIKTIMKKLFFILMLISPALWAQKKPTTIEFEDEGTKKVIKIISESEGKISLPDILKLRNLDLSSVLEALEVDSLGREKAVVLISKSSTGQDTLLVVNRKGNEFSIIAKDIKGVIELPDEIRTYEPADPNASEANPRTRITRPKRRFFPRSEVQFYLGLNNYTNGPNDMADLRAWPSKYVSIGLKRNVTLGNTNKAHSVFTFGPEFSWHNFMLENSNRLIYEGGQSEFVKSTLTTTKSKVTVPHLMLPAMFRFGFKKDKLSLGVGAYLGYRTGGHTKIKTVNPKSKNKYSEDVKGLENLKYGLTAEMGRKRTSLFIRYDLSSLFKENQQAVPDMNAFSFGVKLF